jgi:MoxR-like ATPase
MLLNKLREMYSEMVLSNIEREEEVRGLIIGLICEVNVAFIGPPGTAKSSMVDGLCSRIGGKYFSYLFTKFTTPDEFLGHVSLKGYENDKRYLVTDGKLPQADIFFGDEVFKSNSAALNSLLKIAQERVFDDGNGLQRIPLKMMVIASNELPVQEERLEAFWDRFLLRYQVRYIQEDGNFLRMLKGNVEPTHTTITPEELQEIREKVKSVEVPDSIYYLALKIHKELTKQNLVVSDRRYKESIVLLKGSAYLAGRSVVTDEDLDILVNCYWSELDDYSTVRKIITYATANMFAMKAADDYARAVQEYNEALHKAPQVISSDEDLISRTKVAQTTNIKLREILNLLETYRNDAADQGHDITIIEGYIFNLNKMIKSLVDNYLLGRKVAGKGL